MKDDEKAEQVVAAMTGERDGWSRCGYDSRHGIKWVGLDPNACCGRWFKQERGWSIRCTDCVIRQPHKVWADNYTIVYVDGKVYDGR